MRVKFVDIGQEKEDKLNKDILRVQRGILLRFLKRATEKLSQSPCSISLDIDSLIPHCPPAIARLSGLAV